MKRAILLIPLALVAVTNVWGQSIGPSTLNAAGGTAVIGTNEFDWSVGEMTMVSTFSSSSIIVTQGVLQPAESTVGVPNITSLTKQLKVFPNPASSVVNIEYTSAANGTLAYRLLDMNGKVVSKQKVNTTNGTTTTQINLQEVACASYMLEVTVNPDTKAESISYKIQKIK